MHQSLRITTIVLWVRWEDGMSLNQPVQRFFIDDLPKLYRILTSVLLPT